MPSIINATTTGGVVVSGDNSGSLQLASNNGTTAVTVTTAQLVGIGTTSPSAKLDINGGGSTAKINTLDTFDGGASLSTWMKVGRRAGTGNNSYINTSHDGSDAVDGLAFAFGTSGTGTEQMRITSAGLLQFNSGYGSVATAYGCRVWVNFNGTGTPAIRGSGNVTSITDHSTGEYTVNFTTALPDTNYAVVSLNSTPGGDAGDATQVNTYATSSVRLKLFDRSGNLYDATQIHVVVFR